MALEIRRNGEIIPLQQEEELPTLEDSTVEQNDKVFDTQELESLLTYSIQINRGILKVSKKHTYFNFVHAFLQMCCLIVITVVLLLLAYHKW